MAYDETLAYRLREAFARREDIAADVVERKMFGGLAFMVRGNMAVGINGERLMARVGPEQYETLLALPHAREMDFTGRTMKGFLFVDPPGIESDEDLAAWVDRCLDFVLTLPPK